MPSAIADNALPHITVATVVERSGRLLMVQERSDGRLVYNQPAGHVEAGETLVDAAVRETLEETSWHVNVTALLGVYQYTAGNGISYVRHCFIAEPVQQQSDFSLDSDIEQALWLSIGEIQSRHAEMRSPLVLAAVNDYVSGARYPLTLLTNY